MTFAKCSKKHTESSGARSSNKKLLSIGTTKQFRINKSEDKKTFSYLLKEFLEARRKNRVPTKFSEKKSREQKQKSREI